MLHPMFPIAPVSQPVNLTNQTIFTVVQLPLVVAAIYLAVRHGRQGRGWVPALLVFSGSLSVFLEPVVDILGCCWFYVPGQWTFFTSLGVHLPVWIVPAYIWFFGGQAALCWRYLSQAPTPRTAMRLYAVVFLSDAVLEHGGLYLGVFTYYGHQPFTFTRFPLWWAAINSMTPVVVAALTLYLAPLLRGRRILLLVILGPLATALCNGGAGWPTYLAINTNLSKPVVWLAGCVTLGLVAMMLTLLRAVLAQAPPQAIATVPEPRAAEPAGSGQFAMRS